MKHSEILREARNFLAYDIRDYGKFRFICVAIMAVESCTLDINEKNILKKCQELCDWIESMLGTDTYDKYVKKQGINPDQNTIQQMRHYWLADLITYLEKHGK
jgi:hypothetical protein